jgi:hypothetical protein
MSLLKVQAPDETDKRPRYRHRCGRIRHQDREPSPVVADMIRTITTALDAA